MGMLSYVKFLGNHRGGWLFILGASTVPTGPRVQELLWFRHLHHGVSYALVITLSLQCDVLLTGRKLHTLSLPPSEPLTGLCKHQRGSKQAKMLSSFSMIKG